MNDLLIKPWREAKNEFARIYFEALMERCGWNAAKAAKEAGVNRTEIYHSFKRYKVKKHDRNANPSGQSVQGGGQGGVALGPQGSNNQVPGQGG